MWIDHQLFPFEITRHASCFLSAFQDDYDLRFQESRDRRIRLISFEHPNEDALKSLAKEWKQAPERVSYLDWGQLMEWAEEYRCLSLKHLVHTALRMLMQEDLSPAQRAILNRLREIDQQLNALPPIESSSWIDLLKIRWAVPALVDEAQYLAERLKTMPAGYAF